jgi:hypothetical protein
MCDELVVYIPGMEAVNVRGSSAAHAASSIPDLARIQDFMRHLGGSIDGMANVARLFISGGM